LRFQSNSLRQAAADRPSIGKMEMMG